MPSAEAGEESAVGRVGAAGLLLALLVPPPERKILSKGMETYMLWFQSVFLKIKGRGSANIDWSAFLPFSGSFIGEPPFSMITAV